MTKQTAEALAPVVNEALGVEKAAAVVPAAPAPTKAKAAKISLFDAFDDMQALLDTEEGGVPEEMHAEFEAALSGAREVAMAKVDRCIEFHLALKNGIEFHKQRKALIALGQQRLENALERYRGYLLLVCDRFGERKPRKKGSEELGPPQLKGNLGTISTRAGGTAVSIEDAAAIPPEYLNTTVKLPFPLWAALIDAYVAAHGAAGEDARVALLRAIKLENTVDEKAVKAALSSGEDVPGADLRFQSDSLVVPSGGKADAHADD